MDTLGQSCITHYKMNDIARNKVVLDSKGFSNGTAQQNTNLLSVDGKVGGGLSFNGTSDYINTNNTFQSVFQSDFSISLWIKPTDGKPPEDMMFLGVDQQLGKNKFYITLQGVTGLIQVAYTAESFGTVPFINTPSVFQDGQETWHHIVAMVKQISGGINISLYFDNVLVKSEDFIAESYLMASYVSAFSPFIGEINGWGTPGGEKFEGVLDNIMFFNKVLTTAEITLLWNGGLGTENLGATLETVLVYMMCNDADISAIVGTKVFPVIISRSALLPVITYQLIDSDYSYTLGGTINLVRCRYQLNCWAVTYKVARQLADVVKALFDGYSGTVLDIPIRHIEIVDESDMVEPPELEALKRFGKRIDLMIWYHEQT